VLSDQKAEEDRRSKQMEHLFTEEADGMWRRQEELWKEEKNARDQLMRDVIQGWKEQIEDKIQGEKGNSGRPR